MSPEEAIAVLKAATAIDSLAGLALRVAAVAGARRCGDRRPPLGRPARAPC